MSPKEKAKLMEDLKYELYLNPKTKGKLDELNEHDRDIVLEKIFDLRIKSGKPIKGREHIELLRKWTEIHSWWKSMMDRVPEERKQEALEKIYDQMVRETLSAKGKGLSTLRP